MAELVQSMDRVVGEPLSDQAINMLGPQILIPHTVSQHGVDGDQHAMPHCQGRFLRTPAPEQTTIRRAQIRPPRATRPQPHSTNKGFGQGFP
jgi:hypothetical protein